MCGFTCLVKRRGVHTPIGSVVPPDTLRHRGPDYTHEVIDGPVAIRHWRLAIVDLSDHSNQPIYNQDEIFVYNGELYDYQTLGENFGIDECGDTRIFQNILTQSDGLEVLQGSPGFFAFLMYKKTEGKILGGRDLFGKKPLFYYVDSEIAVFSSEEKGIISLLPSLRINTSTLGRYFLYKNRFFGSSFFNGVRELAPGAVFTFDIDAWTFSESRTWQEYYSMSLLDSLSRFSLDFEPEDFFPDLYLSLFERAVERRLNCDVPVQIALSGGVDSAALAAIALNSGSASNVLQAITVKFSEGLDESTRAKQTANLLSFPHRLVHFDSSSFVSQMRTVVRALDGAIEHPHSLAYFQMCRKVREYGKVLLTGEGADEIFFGYSHYENFKNESFAFRNT